MELAEVSRKILRFCVLSTFWCYFARSSILDSRYKHRAVGETFTVRHEQASAISQPSVLGIRRFEGDTVQARLELRELERKPDQFNVFLLGLQRFQNVSQDDQFSYFSIAGTYLTCERPHESLTVSNMV
jgi:tyrosinase